MLYKKRCVREVFFVRVRYKVFGMIFENGNIQKGAKEETGEMKESRRY